jgi:hypothetical protein
MKQKITWKTSDSFPGCQLGDNIVLKAPSLNDLPLDFLNRGHNFDTTKPLVCENSLCYHITAGKLHTKDENEKYDVDTIKFESYNGTSYYGPDYIKQFMLKQSKCYLTGDNKALVIVNKNYVAVVAAKLLEGNTVFIPDEPAPEHTRRIYGHDEIKYIGLTGNDIESLINFVDYYINDNRKDPKTEIKKLEAIKARLNA